VTLDFLKPREIARDINTLGLSLVSKRIIISE